MNNSVTVLALLVSLLLAGCAGGNATTGPTPSADDPVGLKEVEFEGEGGAVSGTVTDDQMAPIPGAQVAIGDLGVVQTDEGGVFEFQNVPPGPQTIYASALGYASVGKKIEVVAGEQAVVSFLLEELAVEEAYVAIDQNEGHICLQVGIAHPTGATPGIYVNFGNLMCPNAGLIFIGFEVEPGIQALVTEMVWQPTSGVTSRELRIENWQGGARSGAFTFDHRYGSAAGPSPVILRYGLAEGEAFEGITNETATVDNAVIVPPDTAKPGGLNVVFDQRTTIYNSMFYGMVPDETYSSLPDA